jgi:hypothetical protein
VAASGTDRSKKCAADKLFVRLHRNGMDTAIGVESSVERPETGMARPSKCGGSIP